MPTIADRRRKQAVKEKAISLLAYGAEYITIKDVISAVEGESYSNSYVLDALVRMERDGYLKEHEKVEEGATKKPIRAWEKGDVEFIPEKFITIEDIMPDIRQSIASGKITHADIMVDTGHSKHRVTQALKSMVSSGEVEETYVDGRYEYAFLKDQKPQSTGKPVNWLTKKW